MSRANANKTFGEKVHRATMINWIFFGYANKVIASGGKVSDAAKEFCASPLFNDEAVLSNVNLCKYYYVILDQLKHERKLNKSEQSATGDGSGIKEGI